MCVYFFPRVSLSLCVYTCTHVLIVCNVRVCSGKARRKPTNTCVCVYVCVCLYLCLCVFILQRRTSARTEVEPEIEEKAEEVVGSKAKHDRRHPILSDGDAQD